MLKVRIYYKKSKRYLIRSEKIVEITFAILLVALAITFLNFIICFYSLNKNKYPTEKLEKIPDNLEIKLRGIELDLENIKHYVRNIDGKEQTEKCFKNKQRQSHDNALKWLDKLQERQSDAWVSFKERKINLLPSLYYNMMTQPENDYSEKLFNRTLAECREMDKLDGKNDVYKTMKGILQL